MIYGQAYDAGTILTRDRVADRPGMEAIYYREADLEENIGESKTANINAAMKDADRLELRPWPASFPRHAWVDWTPRYEAEGDTGLRLELHTLDALGNDTHPAPAGAAAFTQAPRELLDPSSGRICRALSWREVQTRHGSEWLRLDTKNETGGTRLKEPIALNFSRLRGAGFRLVLPDNSLFSPFDLRYPERYIVTNDAGQVVTGEHWLNLSPRGLYRFYLRPRRWRYVAIVIAHYWIVSGFESFPADEVFTRSHFDRPPFYPYRHDVNTSRLLDYYQNFYGEPRAYDAGIDWQWNHSRNAAALRHEIIEGQIYTLCWAKIFTGNEDADVTLWRYPPRAGDVVLGIGRVDASTGSESRLWIHQRDDGTAQYPMTLVGQFYVPFTVAT